MTEKKVEIVVGKDEALVLFDLLFDFKMQSSLPELITAARLALIRLHGALEKTLVEPFLPEYGELLDSARKRLIQAAEVDN